METEQLQKIILDALEDRKAVDVHVVDVRNKSNITDVMVVASGTSSRHVKSLADNVVDKVREHNIRPLGVEGEEVGEWVLVDVGDVVVHVMLPQVREFYGLERLWSVEAADTTPMVGAPASRRRT